MTNLELLEKSRVLGADLLGRINTRLEPWMVGFVEEDGSKIDGENNPSYRVSFEDSPDIGFWAVREEWKDADGNFQARNTRDKGRGGVKSLERFGYVADRDFSFTVRVSCNVETDRTRFSYEAIDRDVIG